MRAAIEPDDSRFVDHLRLHHDRIPCLDDLIVAVVAVRNHGRHGGWEKQASILEPHIYRRGRIVKPFQAIPLGGGRRGREAGKQSIGRISDDGRPEAGQHLRTGLQPAQRIVIRTALLFLQLGRLFRGVERLVLQPCGALEWNGGSGTPEAVKVGMYAHRWLRRLREDAQRCRKSQNPKETRCARAAARWYGIHTLLCRE